jgi:hypothetical protein
VSACHSCYERHRLDPTQSAGISAVGQDEDVELPFVDEHRVVIAAPPEAVWRVLTRLVARPRRGTEAFAHVLGAHPRRASGGPFAAGATVPGFEVAEAVPGRLLRLIGHHRFSRYELSYALYPSSNGTVLSARTHAAFLGLRGTLYRGFVIGSGAHRVLLRRQLRAVRRQIN